jgi:hypothetical protein
MEIAHASPLWDGGVVVLQVSDAKERTLELRALISARSVKCYGGMGFALRGS